MAAGAGFSTLENVTYISMAAALHNTVLELLSSVVRLFSAMLHICMTGTAAFWFAYFLYFPGRRCRFLKYAGLVAMVFCHGTFDALCAFTAVFNPEDCFTRVDCPHAAKVSAAIAFGKHWPASECNFNRYGKIVTSCTPRPFQPGTTLCSPSITAQMINASASCTPMACPADPLDSVCGPAFVSWLPHGQWPSFAFGIIVIIQFFALLCCVLPRMERDFAESSIAGGSEERES
jgi:hypothetical protein